jgi:CheY-like chemotaxis protein
MSKAQAKRRYQPKIHPRRIVIMDDQPEIGECFEVMLRDYLFRGLDQLEILTFTDPAKAMNELLREQPDLLVTDWNHTGMSCYEMFEVLAATKIRYPIFVVTASACQELEEKLLKRGDRLGLTIKLQAKPVLLDDFRGMMRPHFHLSP